jgi:dipeptidyl aminopeptidase/acylaminoacyl peptidase
VLEPSIPLAPMGVASDPLLALDACVAPAITQTVELGITDPNRVGVMGVSYGGYTTAGLIARSKQFRAAIALSGIYDLVSYYGLADRRYRYRPDAFAAYLGPYGSESQQMRMGVPLWRDFERYWRNSPLAYVENIDTPVLLVHGSTDVVPVSGAEELFASLNRLGRRAELVRYVSEGHSVESPANILDLWQRMYAWFDEFLRGENGSG